MKGTKNPPSSFENSQIFSVKNGLCYAFSYYEWQEKCLAEWIRWGKGFVLFFYIAQLSWINIGCELVSISVAISSFQENQKNFLQ